MPDACPNCRAPLTTVMGNCPSCGASLLPANRAPPSRPAQAYGQPVGSQRGPRLVLKGAAGDVAEFPLAERAIIGRSTGAEVQLADREVSRRHTALEKQGDVYFTRDLGSSNGTFVNGRRIAGLTPMKHGDEILVGTTRLVFVSSDDKGDGVASIVAGPASEPVVARVEAVSRTFLPEDQLKESELRRDYERLRIGHEFQRGVRLERDLHALLKKILDVAFDLIACDNGVIFLREAATGQLVSEAIKHRRDNHERVLVSSTLIAEVTARKEAVLTSDAIADERFQSSHSIIGLNVRSAMAVPLLSGDDVRGIMFLDTRERIGAFTTKDLEVLSSIASQASVALENSELARQIEKDSEQRSQLARFLSPALVEQAQRGAIDIAKGGALTEVTLLFSDIRGFTSMSEKIPAQETVRMLNEYFELMVDVVFSENGILDKFIGDAIMAMWGAPVKRADDAARALRAAIGMQHKIVEFNQLRMSQGKPPIAAGIGVHTAEVVVGNMGSTKHMEYTAIGDGVNLASRLCDLAAAGTVIASEACIRRAGEGFQVEALRPAKVKGREQPVQIYRVVG